MHGRDEERKCMRLDKRRRGEAEKKSWNEKGEKRRQCDGSSDHVKLVSIDLARAQFNTHTCLSSFT